MKKVAKQAALIFLATALLAACGGGGGGASTPPSTAPAVTSTTPANNTTNVAVNAAVTATFNEAIDQTTISAATFTMDHGVTGTVSYDAATHIATFTPAANLAYNTTYSATITTGIRSLSEKPMEADYTWQFTTGSAPDTTPPAVASTSPLIGATNVAVNAAITATFNEALDQTTISAATFTMDHGVTGTVTYDAATHIATFTPAANLAYDTTYSATITSGIKSLSEISMATDYTWQFTTGSAPDTTPPTVASTSPLIGATGVPVGAAITATFSEALKPSTLTASSFTVRDGGNNPVAGSVLYSGTTATFTPSTALAYGTPFTATITTAVQDLAGNALVSNYSWSFSTAAAPNGSGTLDTTFNNTGIVAHDNAAGATFGSFDDQGYAITTDGNGRILVTGSSSRTAADTEMVVWRYNPDGTLDTTFGSTGFVVSNGTAGGSNAIDAGQAITVDGNGKIVVAGYSTNAAGNLDMVIWRYNADGTPDTTFNSTGHVVSNGAAGGSGSDLGSGIFIDANGKILVTGYSYNANNNMDMVIWRYNADGTADITFNNGTGYAVNKSAAGATYGADFGSSITTDSSGNILVTGYSTNASLPSNNEDMVIWRYTPSGALDTSFNGKGFVVNSNVAGGTGLDTGSAIAVDANGKIVVAGQSLNTGPNSDLVVWRYNTDGTLDTTFNGTGFVVKNAVAGANGNDYGNGLAIDKNGRIVVSGSSMNVAGNSDIVVLRFNSDGTLDTTFNGTGIVAINNAAGGNSQDYGAKVVIDGNGKILVTGSSTNGNGNLDMVAVRLNP